MLFRILYMSLKMKKIGNLSARKLGFISNKWVLLIGYVCGMVF